jgi:hypothetical protein
VLTDVGAELYGFTHRTFLEYFAASQIVKLHPSAEKLLDELWQRIARYEWDVVAQLATQILGKTVEDGADDFLAGLVSRAALAEDGDERTGALSFAARALEFVVPRPPVLRAIVDAVVDLDCDVYEAGASPIVLNHNIRPVGYLASVTPENLPLTAKYFREAVVRRLQANPEEDRALILGIYPAAFRTGRLPGSRVDTKFWDEVAMENRRVLAPAIAHLKTRQAWVASLLVQDGSMTVQDLVRRFGVRSLYDYSQAGDVIDPPIAYKILHAGVRGTSDRWPVRRALVDQLYDVLTKTPGPWLYRDKHYREIGFLGDYLGEIPIDDDTLRSVAALLALPLFEFEGNMRKAARATQGRQPGRSFQRTQLPSYFLRDEGRSKGTRAPLREMPVSVLRLRPEAEAIVAAWTRGDMDFMSPESSDLLVASPALDLK